MSLDNRHDVLHVIDSQPSFPVFCITTATTTAIPQFLLRECKQKWVNGFQGEPFEARYVTGLADDNLVTGEQVAQELFPRFLPGELLLAQQTRNGSVFSLVVKARQVRLEHGEVERP